MRYEPAIQPLESSGFSETRSYTIAATGKAFRNLMDGLYGRKIEAVIRELATNAFDSHTEAGYPHRQFEVSLPTELKPFFKIRDFGIGMTHEQVMRRYSTLFDSTKDTSNEQVGMLGLGSKSPFAYTDGFTLRCWDGEVRRTYSSYLGEGGVPLISVADISPSDEPRGVEVSFPTKPTDRQQFYRDAERVFKGFPTLPLGLPADMCQRIAVAPSKVGTGWAVVSRGYMPAESNVWALQGCVYYPVDLSQVEDVYASELAAYNSSIQVLLDFPIGELEFTPGRETLAYSESTVSNINKRWKIFKSEINELFSEEFKTCKTGWEKTVVAARSNLTSLFSGLFRLSQDYAETSEIKKNFNSVLPDTLCDTTDRSEKLFTLINSDGEQRRSQRRRSRGYYYSNPMPKDVVDSKGNEVLWIERSHGVKLPWKRIQHYLQNSGHRWAVCWAEPHPDMLEEDEELGDLTPDLSLYGNPPVLKTKDMPEPPPPPRPSTQDRSGWIRFVSKAQLQPDGTLKWSEEPLGEDDLPENAEFLFWTGSRYVVPQKTGQAKSWPTLDLNIRSYFENLSDRAKMLGEKVSLPVIIRMKAGEVYGKWAARRLHDPSMKAIVENLNLPTVRRLINVRNAQTFRETKYHGYLNHYRSLYRQLRMSPPESPIWGLRRFENRLASIPEAEIRKMRHFLDSLNLEEINQVVEIGLRAGLEVLPELRSSWTRTLPYDLLPLRWEHAAHTIMALTNGRTEEISRKIASKLVKEALEADRKERLGKNDSRG